jgi:bifunctional enzyme CysN/CysC
MRYLAPKFFRFYRTTWSVESDVITPIKSGEVFAGRSAAASQRHSNIYPHCDYPSEPFIYQAAQRQRSFVIWLTGISGGAGKSTIAGLINETLHQRGFHTFLLDGDNLRHGSNSDLDFSDASRH